MIEYIKELPQMRRRLQDKAGQGGHYKTFFLNSVFLFAGIVAAGMGFVRWQGNAVLGMVDFVFAAICFGLLRYLNRHQEKIEIVSNLAIAFCYLLFLTIYLLAADNSTRLSLFFLLLASVIFLKGRKIGLYWLVLILLTIVAGYALPFPGIAFSHIDILTNSLYLIAFYFIFNNYEIYKEELTARTKDQEVLRLSEERWRLALEGAGDAVWDWNIQSNDLQYSKRFMDMLGYSENELDNSHEKLLAIIHAQDVPEFKEKLSTYLDNGAGQFVVEYRVLCQDGTWKWVLCRGMVTHRDHAGRPARMAGTHTDISEKKKAEALIWTQANYDSLTNLPNRRLFRDRLEHEIKKAQRDRNFVALLFIDLDRFKEVNDALGHQMGDQLLIEAARRIRHCVRESDTVARLGGDEFTVILPELSDFSDIERISRSILDALAEQFLLGEEHVYISASVGITVYPEDATDIDDLTKNADQALYAAKREGRNRFNYFTSIMQEVAQVRMRLVSDMRQALSANEFMVYYQPIVDLATGNIRKAEALLRWKHPKQGFISPQAFIPIAEDTGVINDLGDMVFREAARQVKRWQEIHAADFQISINKSPVQFRADSQGQNHWLEKLREQGLKGSSIVIEITEGLLLHADAMITDKLLKFRDAGIQVAIDDFGTGYSSLAYLKKFDIDYLKIDRSFIQNLTPGSPDFALSEAIVVMAHKLGLKVIAEGVETERQRDMLKQIGCDYAQGYLYSQPVPAEEFEALLRA